MSVDFVALYPALHLYCQAHSLPIPNVTLGRPQTKNAIAACHPTEWAVIVDEEFGQVSEKTMGHELAHLIVRQTDRMDSITHGPKFIDKEMEIERFCTMERRKRIRQKRGR